MSFSTYSPLSSKRIFVSKYKYRPAVRLTTSARILLLVSGLTIAFVALVVWLKVPANPQAPRIGDALLGVAIIGSARLLPLLLLTTMVVFLLWMQRANKNVRALGAQGIRCTPGWAVGWWFVPIATLFKPYQAMREIYQASDPGAGPASWAGRPAGLVGAWWAAWLGTGVSLVVLQDAAEAHPGAVLVVSASLLLVAAVLASQVIKKVLDGQQRLAAARRDEDTPMSQPDPDETDGAAEP